MNDDSFRLRFYGSLTAIVPSILVTLLTSRLPYMTTGTVMATAHLWRMVDISAGAGEGSMACSVSNVRDNIAKNSI